MRTFGNHNGDNLTSVYYAISTTEFVCVAHPADLPLTDSPAVVQLGR